MKLQIIISLQMAAIQKEEEKEGEREKRKGFSGSSKSRGNMNHLCKA